MIKSEFIEEMGGKLTHMSLSEKNVMHAVNSILETMTNSLINDQRIEIRGFGSFTVHHFEPRKARNPKTRESVTTRHRHKAHFKPGKKLREMVNASRHLPIQERS
ncbi:MAG: HU family DNA-binding protein [Legionellaceae bacterium]|nr:HU family DNA-binding protein [Legionellaceae bacterium]